MLTLSIWQLLILVILIAVVAVICTLVGAWIAYKSKNAQPYEPFLGKAPKGEVFSIPDALDNEEFPDQGETEKKILEKTEKFLNILANK